MRKSQKDDFESYSCISHFSLHEEVQGLQFLEPCELKESNGEEIPLMMQRYKWAGPWTFPVCCLLSLNSLMAWENRFSVLLCFFPPLSDVAYSALSHSGRAVFGFVLDH